MSNESGKKSIESLMTEERSFPPSDDFRSNAYVSSQEQYELMWEKSIESPDEFWLEQAKTLD